MADETGSGGASELEAARPQPGAPELTDAELTVLALGADPDEPLDRDAVPLCLGAGEMSGQLPEWYMPPVRAHRGRRWRTTVVLLIVAAFLVIEAVGLCSTYGQLVRG